MEWFLGTVIGVAALSSVGKLIWLAKSDLPPRRPSAEAVDVVFNAALIAWAAVLLSRI